MRVKKYLSLIIFGWGAFLSIAPASTQTNIVGRWAAPVELNIDGVHGAVLPSGKVLYLPHRVNPSGVTESVVFDPNQPSGAKYITVPANYFCGGHTILSDGRLLFMGGEDIGDNALNKSGYYDYTTETWTEVATMKRYRWYPSAIELGDGTVWAFGGQAVPADESQNDDTIEFYDPVTNSWTMAGGQNIPGQYTEAYNRLHLLPDGKIFQSGHLPQTYTYDPVAKTWTFVANTNLGLARGNGSSVRLQDGRIMIMGGENKINYFDSAEIIDLTQPVPQWQTVTSMTSRRAFIDAVMLPDGNVLVVGGDEGTGNRSTTPELYSPTTNMWTDMAAHSIERGYHSTALLLADARVILSGGEGQHGPGVFGESAKFEIWEPYYLFKTARPVIQNLPAMAGYGQQLAVNYSSTVPISHVVIHRSGSQTHSFTYNQISHPVSLNSNNGSVATFTVPSNPNLLPPGFYMVFLMTTDGVPSVARFLQLPGGSTIFADSFESGNTTAWGATVDGS